MSDQSENADQRSDHSSRAAEHPLAGDSGSTPGGQSTESEKAQELKQPKDAKTGQFRSVRDLGVEEIEGVLKQNILNVLAKVERGETLSGVEKKLFEKLKQERFRSGSPLMEHEEVPGVTDEMTPDVEQGDRKYRILQRRQRVFELRLEGKTPVEIAAQLRKEGTQTSAKIVLRDFAHLEQKFWVADHKAHAKRILNEKLEELEAIKRMNLQNAQKATGSEKASFMNLVMQAGRDQVKLLQDAGILKVAPRRTEVTGADGGPVKTNHGLDIDGLSTAELLQLESLVGRATQPGADRRN